MRPLTLVHQQSMISRRIRKSDAKWFHIHVSIRLVPTSNHYCRSCPVCHTAKRTSLSEHVRSSRSFLKTASSCAEAFYVVTSPLSLQQSALYAYQPTSEPHRSPLHKQDVRLTCRFGSSTSDGASMRSRECAGYIP